MLAWRVHRSMGSIQRKQKLSEVQKSHGIFIASSSAYLYRAHSAEHRSNIFEINPSLSLLPYHAKSVMPVHGEWDIRYTASRLLLHHRHIDSLKEIEESKIASLNLNIIMKRNANALCRPALFLISVFFIRNFQNRRPHHSLLCGGSPPIRARFKIIICNLFTCGRHMGCAFSETSSIRCTRV